MSEQGNARNERTGQGQAEGGAACVCVCVFVGVLVHVGLGEALDIEVMVSLDTVCSSHGAGEVTVQKSFGFRSHFVS